MSDNEYNEDPVNEENPSEEVTIPPMEDQPEQVEQQPPAEEENAGNDAKEAVPEISEPVSEPVPKASTTYASTSSKPVPTSLDPESAWKEICHEPPSINWYLLSLDKKMDLVFKKAGKNGFQEFTEFLKNSSGEIYFGLLRVNSNDRGGSKRAKFVYVRFVGSSVGTMQKAKITPKLGKIGDSFPVKHMTYDLTEDLGNFTIEGLAKEMLRVGGAHKPDSYDFGPNQAYQCK